ncbi:MAG TPA: protein kinase family protein [Actinocrinis sp.]|uniref:protein kinase family protein n=1 Tax=Actinocrinis sp. TaxID=1920516 RepID=UPI002DDCC153|nr:protein kinase family protein [Actinocrinis sp.]HEV3171462.1 protein kinase family protein [Actinocrinis sp.]
MASLAEKPVGDSENFDRARFEQQVHAGARLADRYRLDRELRRYSGGVEPLPRAWVGFDELLNRKVGIDLISSGHPRARVIEGAARNAATVPDVHFVQVLDAADESGLVYVVKEWVADAASLSTLLANGPLSTAKATAIARELATAVAAAHDCDMPHGALDPTTVLVTSTGQVKILGLCLERALAGLENGPDAQAEDVRAIGRLWYAALTGRWPTEDGGFGLPGAPFSHGKPFSPAQIRAAVPKTVDQLVSQILGASDGSGEATGASTIESAKALVTGIAALPRFREEPEATSVLPRTTYPQRPGGYPAASRTVAVPQSRTMTGGRPPRRYSRGLIVIIVGVVLVIGTVAAFELGGRHNSPSASSSNSPAPRSASSAPATQPLAITTASIWDSDKGQDDTTNLPHAYDGSSTGWTTSTYFDGPTIAPYRAGSGIVFDLGSAKSVSRVKFDVAVAGATVEVWTGSSSLSSVPTVTNSAPPGFTKQSAQANVGGGGDITASFSSPVTTRFVMVWFTVLPHQDADQNDIAGYRDTLSNVRIFS